MTPEAWIARCAARLAQLITDEGVESAELEALAADMIEDRRYSVLEPEAAAELHAADFA